MKREEQQVYIKCRRSVVVTQADVFLKDVAVLRCRDKALESRLSGIKIHHFGCSGTQRIVVDCLYLVEQMEKVRPDIVVSVVGDTDICIERKPPGRRNRTMDACKIIFVSLIGFFGTAFTIMAYHNDVGIKEVFRQVYRLAMGTEPGGITILEISYAIGLSLGIILFFNHLGRRRITGDPTPIEVSMRNYEEDVDKTLIETADRMGREKDCSQ